MAAHPRCAPRVDGLTAVLALSGSLRTASDVDGGHEPLVPLEHVLSAATLAAAAASPASSRHYVRTTANAWLPAPIKGALAVVHALADGRQSVVPSGDVVAGFLALVGVAALDPASPPAPPSVQRWQHALACAPALWDLAVTHGGVRKGAPCGGAGDGTAVRRALRRTAHVADA